MYNSPFHISQPTWNNEFSHAERLALWSKWEIYVPSLIKGTTKDLEIWTEITFEEVSNNKLISCYGLKNFVQTDYEWIPIYIFDNHNHALFFRYRHMQAYWDAKDLKPFKVLHVDQHSDIKPNPNSFDIQHTSPSEVFGFTNYACNVWNFLTSAKDSWLIQETIQIRSETALHSIPKMNKVKSDFSGLDYQNYNYILDIDIDFRIDKKDIENDIKIIKNLIKNVSIVTIATSPYFIDQNRAIEIIKEILAY